MKELRNPGRRALLQQAALGLWLAPLALAAGPATAAADLPLISEQDPAAKAVHYVEDARRAEAGASGAECSNCSIYSAVAGASKGTCTLFPGKLVKAAGWCNQWSGL
ncbi:MAG: high-potential iron-sulfur protein [Steroidobacterales bacterium]